MKESKEILARCRGFLTKCRSEITLIVENPVLSDWARINIREFDDLLESLEIPPNLLHAQNQYLNEAKKASLQIEALENEVGSLEADLNLRLVSPEKLLLDSCKTEANCRELEKTMTTLSCYVEILKGVDKSIRELLVLERFFPIARRLSENPEGFDSGVSVFYALSMDKEEKTPNVYELFADTNRLEARLGNIDLSSFTGVVISVLKNRLDTCLDATREIKNYIDHTASSVSKELNAMKALAERLKGYDLDPISLLLKSLKREAASITKALSDLRRHGYVIQELDYVIQLMQEISAFCTGMKQEVTGKLREAVKTPTSPLSPSHTATTLAHGFFGGLRGFFRMVRMLILSLAGGPLLSEKNLQQYIENTLHGAPVCKAGSEADQGRFTAFLEESLSDLSKPFPYDDVLTLLQKAVDEYVFVVGRFVDNCEITVELEASPDSSEDGISSEGLEPYTMKTSIGNLVRKIAIRTENLRNHQMMDSE